jgi:F-type H+-transporting ATPase subunit delta
MQGASRESFAVARERLDAVAGAGEGPDAVRLAADLRGVALLLIREPVFRRALADPARSGKERSQLLLGLLGEQVSAGTRQVLGAAVSGRWSRSTDLIDALEQLSVTAELIAAEKARVLAEVEDELFRFGRVVEGDPRLATLLSDPTAEVERRIGLVRALLDGKATEYTGRLAELAVMGLGGRGFDASLQRLVELAAERRDREVAYVRTAVALTEQQEERLAAKLSDVYGRQISLKIQVDPALVGGATVRVGNDLYDGSVVHRLDQARTALAKK